MASTSTNIPEFITQRLENHTAKKVNISHLRQSSVLIPLFPTEQSYYILMTARSGNLNHHAGEMSFPGGRFETDQDCSLKATALRETYEEIGIPPEDFKILGYLDDLPTLTGFCIRPFIGYYTSSHPPTFKKNPTEVTHIVQIPVEFLLSLDKFHERLHKVQNSAEFSLLYFDYPDPLHNRKFHIWGASAHLLANYLQVIYEKSVTSDQYDRPTLEDIQKFYSQT